MQITEGNAMKTCVLLQMVARLSMTAVLCPMQGGVTVSLNLATFRVQKFKNFLDQERQFLFCCLCLAPPRLMCFSSMMSQSTIKFVAGAVASRHVTNTFNWDFFHIVFPLGGSVDFSAKAVCDPKWWTTLQHCRC